VKIGVGQGLDVPRVQVAEVGKLPITTVSALTSFRVTMILGSSRLRPEHRFNAEILRCNPHLYVSCRFRKHTLRRNGESSFARADCVATTLHTTLYFMNAAFLHYIHPLDGL
jgi:hypothetical protein